MVDELQVVERVDINRGSGERGEGAASWGIEEAKERGVGAWGWGIGLSKEECAIDSRPA